MKTPRKIYSPEFKQKAIELSNHRGKVPEVAHELGITANLLYRWRKEFHLNQDQAFSGNGNKQMTEEEKELARLKRELADVKMERDILKKAIAIFSVSDRKSSSS